MVKVHPWQRWPDKKKRKKKSRDIGQEKESSWKKSSIQDLKKDIPDERDDERAYRSQAKRAPTKKAKRTLTSIADDEKEHQVRINKLLKESKSK